MPRYSIQLPYQHKEGPDLREFMDLMDLGYHLDNHFGPSLHFMPLAFSPPATPPWRLIFLPSYTILLSFLAL
jgi:hypothetical protein